MAGLMGMPGMGAPEPDADEMGGPPDADADEFTPKDDFEREAVDFLDDSKPMGDRVLALKEAIRICAEKDYGESDEKKPAGGLALVFGGPKKKG